MSNKGNKIKGSQSALFDSFSARTASVLDNKETLLHFSHDSSQIAKHKSDFLKSHYRHLNLQLCDILHNTSQSSNEHIEKTIRRLSWCSSVGLVEEQESGAAHIVKSSKTCKHPFCHICNRRKSARLVQRLLQAVQDPDLSTLFQNKHYYFLTLTVKHNRETRNYNYLSEFKTYQAKLFRSKLWKSHFPYHKSNKQSGWISSIENVIKPESYHIHSHVLIVAPRLTTSISEVQAELQAKWFKITGDSTRLQLDLVREKSKVTETGDSSEVNSHILGAVREIFKYTTKTTTYDKMDSATAELLAQWMIDTKGKNFINAFGMLRGLQLTALKSKWDTKGELFEPHHDRHYHYDITSSILYNHNHKSNYSTAKRREVLPEVYIRSLSQYSIKVSSVIVEVLEQCDVGRTDDQFIEQIGQIVSHAKIEKEKLEQAINDAWEWSEQLAQDERLKSAQLSMLDKLFQNMHTEEVPF